MNVQQLVKLNNERKKMLSKPNLKYYEDLLVYIRLANRKDEQAKEEVLMEMLEHLIEAEQNGVEADAVFGKTPKQLADEIIESLPKEKKLSGIYFMAETLVLMLGVYIASTGIFNIILKQDFELHTGNVLATFGVIIIGFLVLLKILIGGIRKASFKNKKAPWLIPSIAMTIYIFSVSAFTVFVPGFGKSFTVTPLMMTVVGVVLLVVYGVMKLIRK